MHTADTADSWAVDHSLADANLPLFDDAAAENLAVSVERDAFQGDGVSEDTPSPLSYDPYSGPGYDFTAGDFNIDVGAYDADPNTFDTGLDLVDNGFGYDTSGLDYWNDPSYYGSDYSDFGDAWTYESGDEFASYDYTGWDYGDSFAPVVLDLNGDGVDITPRTDSTVYLDVDGDNYEERCAWAGPSDGLLVIDLAENGSYGFARSSQSCARRLEKSKREFAPPHARILLTSGGVLSG